MPKLKVKHVCILALILTSLFIIWIVSDDDESSSSSDNIDTARSSENEHRRSNIDEKSEIDSLKQQMIEIQQHKPWKRFIDDNRFKKKEERKGNNDDRNSPDKNKSNSNNNKKRKNENEKINSFGTNFDTSTNNNNTTTSVLVVGGSGFIGFHAIHTLFHEGFTTKIIALDHLPSLVSKLKQRQNVTLAEQLIQARVANLTATFPAPQLKFILGDLCNTQLLLSLFDEHQFTHVLYTGSERQARRQPVPSHHLIETNIKCFSSLLEAITQFTQAKKEDMQRRLLLKLHEKRKLNEQLSPKQTAFVEQELEQVIRISNQKVKPPALVFLSSSAVYDDKWSGKFESDESRMNGDKSNGRVRSNDNNNNNEDNEEDDDNANPPAGEEEEKEKEEQEEESAEKVNDNAAAQKMFSTWQRTDSFSNTHSASRKSQEILAWTYYSRFNIPIIGLRVFSVYGPLGTPDTAIFSFTLKIFRSEPITLYENPKTTAFLERDYIYVQDLAHICLISLVFATPTSGSKLLNSGGGGEEENSKFAIINAGYGSSYTALQVLTLLHEAINTQYSQLKQNLTSNETKALEARCASLGFKKNPVVVFEKLPIIPSTTPPRDEQFFAVADLTELTEILNYLPTTDLQEGILKFVSWFIEFYLHQPQVIQNKQLKQGSDLILDLAEKADSRLNKLETFQSQILNSIKLKSIEVAREAGIQLLQDKQVSLPKPTSELKSKEFFFFEGQEFTESETMIMIDFLAGNSHELEKVCNEFDECLGFSSEGYLKFRFGNIKKSRKLAPNSKYKVGTYAASK